MRSWLVAAGATLLLLALLVPANLMSVAAARAAAAPQAPAGAQGGPQDQAQAQASDLGRESVSLVVVCAKCHNLQIVMDTPRSYDAWHDSVQKMVDLGARGTDDQYDDIMDYLHRMVTTIDVNSADPDELEMVLNASESTAQAIVARRKKKKFAGMADLKSIPGIDASTLDEKARMIFFN